MELMACTTSPLPLLKKDVIATLLHTLIDGNKDISYTGDLQT